MASLNPRGVFTEPVVPDAPPPPASLDMKDILLLIQQVQEASRVQSASIMKAVQERSSELSEHRRSSIDALSCLAAAQDKAYSFIADAFHYMKQQQQENDARFSDTEANINKVEQTISSLQEQFNKLLNQGVHRQDRAHFASDSPERGAKSHRIEAGKGAAPQAPYNRSQSVGPSSSTSGEHGDAKLVHIVDLPYPVMRKTSVTIAESMLKKHCPVALSGFEIKAQRSDSRVSIEFAMADQARAFVSAMRAAGGHGRTLPDKCFH